MSVGRLDMRLNLCDKHLMHLQMTLLELSDGWAVLRFLSREGPIRVTLCQHNSNCARHCCAGVEDADNPVGSPSPGGRLKKRARLETGGEDGLQDMEDEPQVVSHQFHPELTFGKP